MRERHALLRQWAVLRHHGVYAFHALEVVTDPWQATSLSIHEYHAQDPGPDDGLAGYAYLSRLPGPMWPHNQTRRMRWVAVRYGATWWVTKTDRDGEMPYDRDWRRVGSLRKALARIARKLHLKP